jgi:hypothetical protein
MDGLIQMAMRDGAIASEARAKGGDGVIMNSDNSNLAAVVTGNTAVIPVYRRSSTFYVIKYL